MTRKVEPTVGSPARKAARTRARSTVIDAYLAKVSDVQHGALEELRKQILAIVPNALRGRARRL